MTVFMGDIVTKYPFMFVEGQAIFGAYNLNDVGEHRLKLEKLEDEVYPHAVKFGCDIEKEIERNFKVQIVSRSLKEVSTNVIIKDADENVYMDQTVLPDEFSAGQVTFELDITQTLYNDVKNGKPITIQLTQQIDGENISVKFGGESFKKSNLPSFGCDVENQWYWGNQYLPAFVDGC